MEGSESAAPSATLRGEVGRLLTLAWPVVVGQVGLVGMGFADLVMVRSLGATATAAVGIGGTLSFSALALTLGAAAGLDPLVTHAYGAGEPRKAGAHALRGAVLMVLLCVPITLVHVFSDVILRAFGQPAAVIPLATEYCRIQAIAVVPFAGFALVRQWLQGGGVMRPAMWVVLITNVVHLGADAAFVYGVPPIPELQFAGLEPQGVRGVAWATTVSRWFMFLALIPAGWSTFRRSWPDEPIDEWKGIWRVFVVAVPVGLQVGLEVWAFNAASFFAGQMGSEHSAAHTAALSAASISFMLPMGLSAAAATRVGNLVGAGHDWRRSAALSLVIAILVMLGPASLFYLQPTLVATVYNTDLAVIALVGTVLPIAAAFQCFDGTQVVAFGVLRGLGDTQVPAVFNVIAYYGVGIPLGFWLAFDRGLGLQGLWLGLTVGLVSVSALLVLRILWHAWRRRRT
jgi:multidrug resistance protein, MATE family